jgi:hypothetical protein
VSDYTLIKDYNPAYRYWIRALLKKKRLMGDREYSWKEAQHISMDMAARGVKDDFFMHYFWAWRDHPEHPPDYFSILGEALPIHKEERPDLAAIAQLDKEARTRGQRILLGIEDAAKDFTDFYDRFLAQPLARDLESGEGEKLMDYFEWDELGRVPDIRVHSKDEMEVAERKIAVELLQWLQNITLEKILDDIKEALSQHYENGLAKASTEHGYHFKSKYVELSANKVPRSKEAVTTILMPARGHSVVKEGYAGVYFPMYYVQKTPL